MKMSMKPTERDGQKLSQSVEMENLDKHDKMRQNDK